MHSRFQNTLLRLMSPQDMEIFRPELEPCAFKVRDVIVRPNTAIEYVYFPESGQLSTLAKIRNFEPIEVGMVGREGMSDMLPGGRTPLETIVQVQGEGHRIPVAALEGQVVASPPFAALMLRYQRFMLIQLSYTALSHGSFTVTERLARWLLMVDDRINGDIPLVHEFFSWMLAVRRAGVTEAMNRLQAQGAISTQRGRVRILDRDALVELASGSYGPPEVEYERLFGVAQNDERTRARLAS
ncbi:MAG: Crp/Fnr family transcriptional regulator [Hyphomicrobiales bacterium]|nr:Crp/Fnr family transcriptional regulator [Hyphomicrobiales bacterium]